MNHKNNHKQIVQNNSMIACLEIEPNIENENIKNISIYTCLIKHNLDK